MSGKHKFSTGQKFKSYKSHPDIPIGTIIKITIINSVKAYVGQELNNDMAIWSWMSEEFLLEYFKPYKNQPRKIKRITWQV